MVCELHLNLRVKMPYSLTAGPEGEPRPSCGSQEVADLYPVLVAWKMPPCVHLTLSGGKAKANPDHAAFYHLL